MAGHNVPLNASVLDCWCKQITLLFKRKGNVHFFLFLLLAGVHPLLYYDCMVYDWIWKKHFLSRRQLKMEHISTIDTLLTAFYQHAVILFWISVFFWLQSAHTRPLFIVNYTLIYLLDAVCRLAVFLSHFFRAKLEIIQSEVWLAFCKNFLKASHRLEPTASN